MSTSIIKPEWSFITITLMVLGFILFWPIGLAVLAYILWGERFGGSSDKAERWISKQKDGWNSRGKRHRSSRHSSGNAAFDDYRQEQMQRLDEERRRLDEEVSQFQGFVRNLRMARDRDEFDRFMRDRRDNQSASRYADKDEQSDDRRPDYRPERD